MSASQFTIELLKIILGAPVIAGAISITFLILFRSDLKALIERIASVKFPGGELTTSQAARGVIPADSEENSLKTATPGQKELASVPQFTERDQRQVADTIDAANARATFWEYQFLNRFLVVDTQRILDWFASLPQRTTLEMYDSYWTPLIQNPAERNAIIVALHNHHLISISNGLVEVSPKGRDYLRWRGPLTLAP